MLVLDSTWRPPLAPFAPAGGDAEALQTLAAAVELRQALDEKADAEGKPRMQPPLVETYAIG